MSIAGKKNANAYKYEISIQFVSSKIFLHHVSMAIRV